MKGTCVPVEFLILGALQNNTYLITCDDALMAVDPSCDADKVLAALQGRKLDAIVLTHHHSDHVGAARALRDATGATVIASDIDAPIICGDKKVPRDDYRFDPCPVDHTVQHGDVLSIGSTPWKVIHTPGHTPGSICLFLDPSFGANKTGAPVLVSGDTLFAGAIGRTDFEGGSLSDMRRSLKRLAVLPDKTVVLPGHDAQTTIGAERRRTFALYA